MTLGNYRVDLHTHSSLSFDGGITKGQYASIFDKGILDCVAITDHNETSFARSLQGEFGEKVIVGEEIRSSDGEIIGLYLEKTIPAGLSAKQTMQEIREQGGLVYIPHPFEQGRYSLQEEVLKTIIKDIDIIEGFNARGILRGKTKKVSESNIAIASSSDAHCRGGIGTAFSIIEKFPDKKSLKQLLKTAEFSNRYSPWYSYLCPGFNKIKNKLFLRGQL